MSRLQGVPCLGEGPLHSGLAGTGALGAQNLAQRCRKKPRKVIDAAFFQRFLRFTVGYTFQQFAPANFPTFAAFLGPTFRLRRPACAQFAAILLRFCLVAKVSEQATQHKALLSSRTDKHRRSACLRRIHCVDNLGVPGGNMRVRSAIKKLCDSCKVVKRRGKLYIVCKASPKVCVKPQLTFR